MTTFRWFKVCHGTVADDKWPLIARKSGQSVAVVIAVWIALLECASEAEDRGSIEAFDPESIDAVLQVPDGTCEKIVTAMSEGKHPRIQDNRILNWDKRQESEVKDPKATMRKRRQRERERLQQESDERSQVTGTGEVSQDFFQENPGVPCDDTASHEQSHDFTVTSRTDIREEYKREEKNNQGSSKNEDYARAHEAFQPVLGESEFPIFPDGEVQPDRTCETGNEPTIEFMELREFYSREARPEGELTGFVEYRQAKAARDWPGLDRIIDDVGNRIKAGVFKKGYAPSLRRYLTERFWKTPIVPPERGGPPPTPTGAGVTEKNANAFQRVLSSMAAPKGDQQ